MGLDNKVIPTYSRHTGLTDSLLGPNHTTDEEPADRS